MMSTTDLHSLPPELLELVAEELDYPSLLSFGLTSRTCRKAAVPGIFRDVSFQVFNRKSLEKDVVTFARILHRSGAFKYVRSFEIDAAFFGPGTRRSQRPWSMRRHIRPCSGSSVLGRSGEIIAAAFTYKDNVAWIPLARLLAKLTGLRDLLFYSRHQFPPCLLKALHYFLPSCKLRIKDFNLRSLLDDSLDPYELKLITSPQLSSISTVCWVRDDAGKDDFHDFALLDILSSGLAPGLAEVYLWFRHRGDDDTMRGTWHGLVRDRAHTSTTERRCLDLLEIERDEDNDRCVTPRILGRLALAIDFSHLKTLRLGDVTAEGLDWLCANSSMQSLRSLRIMFDLVEDRDNIPIEKFSHFLTSLPPLHELEVVGYFDEQALWGLCWQQKDRAPLRRLSLHEGKLADTMTMQYKHIEWLCDHCFNIEDLRVTVQRHLGDWEEVEAYRYIGGLPKLHSLHLSLDCSLTFPTDESSDARHATNQTAAIEPWFEAFEAEVFDPIRVREDDLLLRNGHVMKRIINSAVDESLANAIWDTITASKPDDSVPLQSLKLRPDEGRHDFGELPIGTFLGYLDTAWDIKASVRDDELKPIVNQHCEKYGRRWKWNRPPPSPNVAAIYEHIWPGILSRGHDPKQWKPFWRSRPLWSAVAMVDRIPWV